MGVKSFSDQNLVQLCHSPKYVVIHSLTWGTIGVQNILFLHMNSTEDKEANVQSHESKDLRI